MAGDERNPDCVHRAGTSGGCNTSWENGYAESFIGKLRDECLDKELTLNYNARYAQAIVEHCRREYNQERPHSSLGYRTPVEVAGGVVVAGISPREDTGLTS